MISLKHLIGKKRVDEGFVGLNNVVVTNVQQKTDGTENDGFAQYELTLNITVSAWAEPNKQSIERMKQDVVHQINHHLS